jgi:hypothetical protein
MAESADGDRPVEGYIDEKTLRGQNYGMPPVSP